MFSIRINSINEFELDYITHATKSFCAESFYTFCDERDAIDDVDDALMLSLAREYASQFATDVEFINARVTKHDDESQTVLYDVVVTYNARSESAALLRAIRYAARRCNVNIIQTYSERTKNARRVRVEYFAHHNSQVEAFLDIAEVLQFSATRTNMQHERFYLTRII